MPHVVLLGDSIFDNASYVSPGRSVLDQLHKQLSGDWKATLGAVDGATIPSVSRQIAMLPADATHLMLSIGGNDAIGQSGQLLSDDSTTFAESLHVLAGVLEEFRIAYRELLHQLLSLSKPLAVCTIYDAIPILGPAHRAGLAGFNEAILREAFRAGLPVIDLRIICDQRADFSTTSPIEPSESGGGKIARAIRLALDRMAEDGMGSWVMAHA
ncbi:MAG: SGNH/GDSL hydrolase family protein [Gemmataceae bacterium]|nr:SGNH/GDSL hydrolase family protein [Gemmataceae bacterium]